ncbi:hypothetical protein HY339_01275 [Candidatus Gottesmanbacteria bacterium]|nr:hypothetical protein [Candidatus Gottesmanbacteria bacterium]
MYGFLTVTVAIILTLANSSNYLAGVVRTRPGEVYLGTTHYFEDYFLYLSQFVQGAQGFWLTRNLYTSEATPASILFWPNVLLGKLGGLLGLTPMVSYNLSIIFITFITIITMYSLQRRIFSGRPLQAFIAFLIAATATSFMNRIWVNGQPMWYPFQQWKTPNLALDRLGGVPHQLVQTLLFYLLVSVYFFAQKRKRIVFFVLITLLTTLNPVMSGLFLVSLWAIGRREVVATVVYSVTAFFYNSLTNAQPHIQSKLWEAGQQSATTPLFMLLSIGPVAILGIIGAWSALRRGARPIERFSMLLLAVSYLLYFSRVPAIIGVSNSRVLFPAMYAAWGILGALALPASKKIAALVLGVFLLLTIPTIRWEVQQKLLVKPEERIPLLYLPSDVYAAFTYLRSQDSFDDVVLANPASHMDAMVPALGGHTGYTGHPFATIDGGRKRSEALRFFRMEMPADQAIGWLRRNNIRYVLYTALDGDLMQFRRVYPFVRPIKSTGAGAIIEIL